MKKLPTLLIFFFILQTFSGFVFAEPASGTDDEIIEEVTVEKVDSIPKEETPYVLKLLGRIHPLVVHFPIAFSILCLLIFLLSPLFKRFGLDLLEATSNNFYLFLLVISFLACIGATFTGFVLGKELVLNNPQLKVPMEKHELFAFISTGFAFAVAFCKYFSIKYPKNKLLLSLFVLILITTAVLVGITAHFGGAMIYGDTYFSF